MAVSDQVLVLNERQEDRAGCPPAEVRENKEASRRIWANEDDERAAHPATDRALLVEDIDVHYGKPCRRCAGCRSKSATASRSGCSAPTGPARPRLLTRCRVS